MAALEPSPRIVRLVGVYDANGSLAGELAYWLGARLGLRHCSLCDITHGLVRPKLEWRREVDRLPFDFVAVHLDEREPAVAKASSGKEPCVVAVHDDGSARVIIGAGELEACDGDPAAFADLLASFTGPPEDP